MIILFNVADVFNPSFGHHMNLVVHILSQSLHIAFVMNQKNFGKNLSNSQLAHTQKYYKPVQADQHHFDNVQIPHTTHIDGKYLAQCEFNPILCHYYTRFYQMYCV